MCTHKSAIVGAILQDAIVVGHFDERIRNDVDHVDARIVGDQRGVPEARPDVDVGLGFALHVVDATLEQNTFGSVFVAVLAENVGILKTKLDG